ncbi:helix-turn-helix domain-containing protein [Brevundimonas vitis]|uniref:Helix-turn-helix domain-containing protein n=1 Tax=Brevundimonas vitisensis TaxID=2800818 RepID=A0ABX7BJR5_9CAUL|nr:helix-turn-helix domain-containing protein [Brevundimonas vitisensis]
MALHPEEIKCEVRMTGITLTGLALRHGFSPSACRKALVVPCPRVDRVIAKRIGRKLHEVWPERYDTRGRRIFTKVNSSALQSVPHRLSTQAV